MLQQSLNTYAKKKQYNDSSININICFAVSLEIIFK